MTKSLSLTFIVIVMMISMINAAPLKWKKVSAGGTLPTKRNGQTLQYDQARNRLIMFGGRNGGTFYQDTHIFHFANNSWTQANTPVAPPSRFSMIAGIDKDNDRMIVTVGEGPSKKFYDDVWAFNFNNDSWVELTPKSSARPPFRYGASGGIFFPTGKAIYASHGFSNTRYKDTWAFEFSSSNNWVEKTPKEGVIPFNRCLQAYAMLGPSEFVMFSGCGSGGFGPCPAQDTWIFKDGVWTDATKGSKPAGKLLGNMAQFVNEDVKEKSRKVLMFGGSTSDSLLMFDADTMVWQFVETDGAKPTPRQDAGMCSCLPASGPGFIAMFGGSGNNDLWLLEGNEPTLSPLPLSLGDTFYMIAWILLGVAAILAILSRFLPNKKFFAWALHTFVSPKAYSSRDSKVMSFFNPIWNTTWGEAFCVVIFVIAAVLSLLAGYQNSEGSLGVAFAYLQTFLGAFLIAPVSRTSLLLPLFGISFERALKFHRMIARGFWLSILFHFIMMFSQFGPTVLDFGFSPINQPIFGFLAFICYTLVVAVGYETIRRKRYFEAFHVPHQIFAILGFVFTLIHAPVTITMALPAIGLYVLDRLKKFLQFWKKTELKSITALPGDITRLEFTQDGLSYESGQFLFIKIKQISSVQFHPFSISSHPGNDSGTVTMHIKNMKTDRWTQKLFELAQSKPNAADLDLVVHGPYGSPSVIPHNYQRVVLIAGGIGVTPMISMLSDFNAQMTRKEHQWEKIHFIWSVRNQQELEMFAGELASASSNDNIDVQLYVTGKKDDSDIEVQDIDAKLLHSGRPKVKDILESIKSESNQSQIGVLACGPAPVITSVRNVTSELTDDNTQFHFHKEVFAF